MTGLCCRTVVLLRFDNKHRVKCGRKIILKLIILPRSEGTFSNEQARAFHNPHTNKLEIAHPYTS